MAHGANQLPTIVAELQATDNRLLNESCLLAELLEQDGDSKAASAILTTSVSKTPSEKIILLDQQVRLLKKRHEWLRAAEVSEKLIILPGGRKPMHVQKTLELYEKAGNWEEALTWVAEWKQLAPGSIQPWLTEARLLERNDQPKQAIAILRRGIQQIDDDEPIRVELAALYADHRQVADAMRLYWRLYEDATDVSSCSGPRHSQEQQTKANSLMRSFRPLRTDANLTARPPCPYYHYHKSMHIQAIRRNSVRHFKKPPPNGQRI